MMKYLTLVMVICSLLWAEKPLEYYLPEGTSYDPTIPTPKSELGYQVGEWHVRHDQIVYYMKTLANTSARVTIEEYAQSHEQRPLLLLTITSPENHKQLEEIKKQHSKLRHPEESQDLKLQDMPVVVYMGYTVHGDESSGANAALLVAYYLAAAQGEEVEKLLKNTVILLDPCLNPDGCARFANWANTNKSKNLVADAYTREHTEVWPQGRTNHYWFDLNRDWLLLQHPESQGRVKRFQEWLPNVLTDAHEMGPNSSYFFQPGVPSRNHPLTPAKNYVLTEKIAEFHAKALDQIGSMYYTQERFDDFYYGKGSTYPDIQGSVGILFEQASSGGHLQESINGLLSFPFTIRNQVKTSFSTLEAASQMRVELLEYQRDFYKSSLEQAQTDKTKAFVVEDAGDPGRLFHFAQLLQQHKIKVYRASKEFCAQGKKFSQENTLIVPVQQMQYRLIQAIFEKRTTFQDSSFYDVSAWTLPLAFHLPYYAIESNDFSSDLLSGEWQLSALTPGKLHGGNSDYAYLFEWNHYYAPRALNQLLQQGINVKVATQTFTSKVSSGVKNFSYGTILVPVRIQDKTVQANLDRLMEEVAAKNGIDVYSVKTGLTPVGMDLGSPNFVTIAAPKTMLLVGNSVNAYEAGEVWHLLDHRFDIPLTLVDMSYFASVPLERYETIVMVSGSYSGLDVERLRNWVQQGGNLILIRDAISWASKNSLAQIAYVESPEESKGRHNYAEMQRLLGAQVIGGSIAQIQIDPSHPLYYGYHGELLSVFRRGTMFMQHAKNSYATPGVYSEEPIISGYISPENKAKLKNSAAAIVCGLGRGKIICLADNPNFRAFWYGTNKVFLNAIFFGKIISFSGVEYVNVQK